METNSVAEQPTDLLSYIGGQTFQAVESDDELVTQPPVETPEETAATVVDQNANAVASTDQEPPVATPPQGTEPNDEALRASQQRIQELEQRESQTRAALALVAAQAKQREDDLFNRSLSLMTDEEAESAKSAREQERILSENTYLKSIYQTQQTRQAQAQETIDKTSVAHALLQRLGLPGDDQFVMGALMESSSPTEMIAKARRLATVFQSNQQSVATTTAQAAAEKGVHVAGGESAPAVIPKTAPMRKGELIDMMRERQYVASE